MTDKKKLTTLANSLDGAGFYTLADAVDLLLKRGGEFNDEPTKPGKKEVVEREEAVSIPEDPAELTALMPEDEKMETPEDAIKVVHKAKEMLAKHWNPLAWGENEKREIRGLLEKLFHLAK
jgi:hypothetical protein